MDKPDWDTTISGDVVAWCPECGARLEPPGYAGLLLCPSCGSEFEGEQPWPYSEQPIKGGG